MRKDKNQAIKLRLEGKSYSQVSKALNIPKSTLSYWLKDLKLSKRAQLLIEQRVNETSIKALIKRNKNQTYLAKKRSEEIKKKAIREAGKLKDNKLFLIGVALYWAEGYKKGAFGSKWKGVDFANSDPEMIKLMISFFKSICKVENEKIKIQIIAHSNVDINKAIKYWSRVTKIPKRQFNKTYQQSTSKKSKNPRKNKTLIYGTVHIRINNVKLFFRIIGWIEGFKNNLCKELV
jgi:Homeodomain-like domain